jgi:Bacterial Ig-like domain/Lamin Tail Domain
MTHLRFAAFGAFVVTLVASGLGCEIVSEIDRTKIPGPEGTGGQPTTTSTTSTMGSTGGLGGFGGSGSSSGTGGAGGLGGAGGSGGSSSSSSSSSSGSGGSGGSGGGTMCTVPTDCPATAGECIDRTCVAGMCGEKPRAAGTAVAAQTAGDCKKSQCDGAGKIVDVDDNADVPDDSNDCTDDVCTSGAPSNPSKAANTTCGLNGALKCDGAGHCAGCLVAGDCMGQNTECRTHTCTAGACGVLDAPKGTLLAAQTSGDCKSAQCDGNGATEVVNDNADLPVDNKSCTKDLCAAGVPSNPAEPASTACNEGGGALCNGAGTCVSCLVANDCPGQDTECLKRSCTAGACGTTPVALGTAVASQTAGDCKKVVCDGAGSTTSINDDTDPNNDNNACTTDACMAGVPSHVSAADGATCGAGVTCLNGACTGCGAPSDCPGVDDECKSRTCSLGVCGLAFTASGTAVATQTAGDCQKSQCDGAGNTVSVADNADAPADDGAQCTSDVCAAGVPSHPAKPTNTACNQNGGAVCDAAGACVECNAAAQCPGTDTECKARSCTANACGFAFQPAGTMTSMQTAGDCKVNQCDGSGNIVQVDANGDTPADDGAQCTSDVCSNGAPAHPAKPIDTACNQNGGTLCSAVGTCVQCNAAAQCPGNDTECQARTCSSNTCGQSNAAAGTMTSAQSAGDCKINQCDGAGNIVSSVDNNDLPADDGAQCTSEICTAGVPSHPNKSFGTACNQSGGALCNGAGACVAPSCSDGLHNGSETDIDCGGSCMSCPVNAGCLIAADCQSGVCTGNICVATSCSDGIKNGSETGVDCGGPCAACPAVVSTTPADGATNVAVASTIAVTFNAAMSPATLTAQTSSGACSGSVQISTDGFATCIGIAAPLVFSGGNTVATLTPAPALSFGSTYKVKVTTAAQDPKGNPVAAFTAATGFTTATPGPTCTTGAPVVISQIYGAGGSSGATYQNDFIELHNRGTAAVSLAGWSVQYASAPGSFTSSTPLTGSIQPGGYFLIKGASSGANGAALPTADVTGTINMSSTAGKVALANVTTLLSACTGASVIDLVGFGAGVSCSEGTAAPAPSVTNAVFRAGAGCTDTNNNATDFTAAVASARNSASAPLACTCGDQTLNEGGAAAEADYCAVQFPTSLSIPAGTSAGLIYGRIFEAGVTPAAGAPAGYVAQVGYGPDTSNPESQAGWQWFATTYNVQVGNDDEYQGSFTAPATAGKYRYAYRISPDGVSWTYCDVNGAGSNSGLSFETTQLPVLTVTP